VAIRCLYRSRDDPDTDADVLVLLLMSMIISPLGWVYYLWLPLGPALAVALQRGRIPLAVKLGIAGFMCPLHLTVLGQPSAIATVSIGSLYMWSLALIYMGVVRDVLGRPRKGVRHNAEITCAVG